MQAGSEEVSDCTGWARIGTQASLTLSLCPCRRETGAPRKPRGQGLGPHTCRQALGKGVLQREQGCGGPAHRQRVSTVSAGPEAGVWGRMPCQQSQVGRLWEHLGKAVGQLTRDVFPEQLIPSGVSSKGHVRSGTSVSHRGALPQVQLGFFLCICSRCPSAWPALRIHTLSKADSLSPHALSPSSQPPGGCNLISVLDILRDLG